MIHKLIFNLGNYYSDQNSDKIPLPSLGLFRILILWVMSVNKIFATPLPSDFVRKKKLALFIKQDIIEILFSLKQNIWQWNSSKIREMVDRNSDQCANVFAWLN